ncbi:hypothetical protein [Paenibacillus sp. 481]|uniref:hypothetical protein n=1 Tax=Paenibacillus sp. 481 TaxID=2835869 RepID=UPI001E385618|nr:hypothetical protein [Paenibacillus sp. 481]UHA73719.1 hypothetical protein KIK04_00645 [Paenibacillus sp. 481]
MMWYTTIFILSICVISVNSMQAYASSGSQYRYDQNGNITEVFNGDSKIKFTSDKNGNTINQTVLKNFVVPPVNLLQNANFAQVNQELVNKWEKAIWGTPTTNYHTYTYENRNVQKVSASNMSLHQYVGIKQRVPITAGKPYVANTSVGIEHLQNAKVQLYLDFLGPNDEFIGANVIDHQALTYGSFITLSTSGIVPAKAKSVVIYVLIRAVDDNAAGMIVVRGANLSYEHSRNEVVNYDFQAVAPNGNGMPDIWEIGSWEA